MKKLLCIFIAIMLVSVLCACRNKHDHVQISNKDDTIFDDVNIDIIDGYFYASHEKFIVDEHTVGITVYFTDNGNDAGWKKVRSDD